MGDSFEQLLRKVERIIEKQERRVARLGGRNTPKLTRERQRLSRFRRLRRAMVDGNGTKA